MTSTSVRADDGLPLTVGSLLHARSDVYDDRPFVVCDDDVLTYREAEQASRRLARGLVTAGTSKGTRVAVLHPNTPSFVVAWLAAARIGAVAMPLSTFSTPSELASLLRGADADVLLATTGFRSHDYSEALTSALPELDLTAAGPLWSPTAPALRRVWFDDPPSPVATDWRVDDLIRAGDAIGDDLLAAMEAEVAPSDPMVVVHTSGSTSEPKGVLHAHGPLIRHLDNLNQLRRYEDHEVLFAASPWFWIGGFAYALLGTLVAGARLACSISADAAAVLEVIERERPTMVNGFAAAVAHLPQDPTFADRDLSSIRRGNLYPIMPEAVRPADPGLRHAMLGMTEAGSVCLASDDEGELVERQRGSFGTPVPGFEARIADPETGQPCPVREVGVLWLRSPFLMEGYLGRERADVFDPDQWFCTGDLFHVDADGLYHFHGRAGDLIKTAGANVSPREVEAVLADEAGLRSHVVGLDDPVKGQVVAAAVVSEAPVDLDALQATLRRHLSAYKVPRRLVALRSDEVPMLSSGKLDARALKDLFDER